MKPYYGITYPPIFKCLWLWKKLMCRHGWHLWDECCSYFTADDGGHAHYLVCDACELMVWIDRIDTQYLEVPK